MARRLVESGVRFVQVYSDGEWDAHSNLTGTTPATARRPTCPIDGLLTDLSTRAAGFDAGDLGRRVRPHAGLAERRRPRPQPATAFCIWMAGAGIKGGVSYGETDEIGYKAAVDPRQRSRPARHDAAPAGHRPQAADLLPQRPQLPADRRGGQRRPRSAFLNQPINRELEERVIRAARRYLMLFCFLVSSLSGDDWPQYKGPKRNDVSTETGLLKAWPEDGPKLAWTFRNTGVGLSGPAIVGDRLYTLGGRGETEFLIALDLGDIENQSPKEVWAAPVGPLFEFRGNNWSSGPSSTPTVDGERIYALGGQGNLACFETQTGKPIWQIDLPKALQAEINPIGGGPKKLGWGFTWSPLVDGNKLICLPGGPQGTVAALNKQTGQLLWRSSELTDQAAYTSPVVADIGGTRQYVVLTNEGTSGLDAETGKLLWSHPKQPRYSTEVVNSPIVRSEHVYLTPSARDKAANCSACKRMARPSGSSPFTPTRIWPMITATWFWSAIIFTVFLKAGAGSARSSLPERSLGWVEGNSVRGAPTCADGQLYCYGEDNGEAVLIAAGPLEWKESGRFSIPEQSALRKPKGKIGLLPSSPTATYSCETKSFCSATSSDPESR